MANKQKDEQTYGRTDFGINTVITLCIIRSGLHSERGVATCSLMDYHRMVCN